MKLYESRFKQLQIETDEKLSAQYMTWRETSQAFTWSQSTQQRQRCISCLPKWYWSSFKTVAEQDNDDHAVQLAHTAKIVQKDLFEKSSFFNVSFRKGCQEDSVPELLFALVSMILHGPSTKDQISTTQAALTIAQLLKFSTVRHQRKVG